MESDDTIAQGDPSHDDTILALDGGAAGALAATDPLSLSQTLRDPERVKQSVKATSDALLLEEQSRTRGISGLMAVAGLLTMATLPLFGGTAWAKNLFYACLSLGVCSMTYLWWASGRAEPLEQWKSSTAWACAFTATCANTIYFGIFSPTPVVMTLAVAVLAQGKDLRLARGAYLAAAATQGGFALLDASGILTDPGLLNGDSLNSIERIAGQGLMQIILITAYLIGRSARHASIRAIAKVQQAMREVAQRDVVAREVREGARRALNIGGAGRASGHRFGDFVAAEVIGQGGMGEVYRAEHVETKSPAALKIIHSHLCRDETILKRFLREAELVSTLDSEHIVKVYSSGHDELGAYIVMELMNGRDLATQLQEEGLMSSERLLQVARDVGRGLDAAAAAEIVHRDIKPHNLFLVGSDDRATSRQQSLHCKILDFGIARVMSGHDALTAVDRILGTPAYMAPEQVQGLELDHRVDLHALVAVLYRACTGFVPFTGDNSQAILYAVAHTLPMKPSMRAGLPQPLDAFFAKGFAKDPDERYQSGRELVEALESACR